MRVLFLFAFLLPLSTLLGQDAPASAEAAQAQFSENLDALTTQSLEARAAVIERFTEALERVRDNAKANGDSTTANFATQELERMESGSEQPSKLAGRPEDSDLGRLWKALVSQKEKLKSDYQAGTAEASEVYRVHLTVLTTNSDATIADPAKVALQELAQLNQAAATDSPSGDGLIGIGEEGALYLSFDTPPEANSGWKVGNVVINPVGTPQLVDGRVGNALKLATREDYLDLEGFQPNENMTIATWVRFEKHNWWSSIFKCSSSLNGGDTVQMCRGMGSRKIIFDVQNSGVIRTPDNTIRLGEWMHVIGTYENASHLKIYIDGKLSNSNRIERPMPTGDRVWARIGQSLMDDGDISRKDDNDRTGSLQGCLDEFLYFPRTISDEEAEQLYLQSGGGTPSKPAANSSPAGSGDSTGFFQ